MKQDVSLLTMQYHGLCTGIERNGVICFKPIYCKKLCSTHYHRQLRHKSVNLPDKREKKCKYILCDNPYYSTGYCKNHYAQHSRRNSMKECEADNCGKKASGKYCSMHRTRLYKYGTLDGSGKKKGGYFKIKNYLPKKEFKICLAKACGRNSNDYKITKGLCTQHYQRWRKTKKYND